MTVICVLWKRSRLKWCRNVLLEKFKAAVLDHYHILKRNFWKNFNQLEQHIKIMYLYQYLILIIKAFSEPVLKKLISIWSWTIHNEQNQPIRDTLYNISDLTSSQVIIIIKYNCIFLNNFIIILCKYKIIKF